MLFRTVSKPATNAQVLIKLITVSSGSAPGTLSDALADMQCTTARGKGEAPTLLVSLGRQEAVTSDTLRQVGGKIAQWLLAHDVRRTCLDAESACELARLNSIHGAVETLCEGLALGAFRFHKHKSDAHVARPIAIDVLAAARDRTRLQRELRSVSVVCDSVNLAREWGHEPPNIINPVTLATRLKKLARDTRIKCTVYDEGQLARMKASALVAVGMASQTPARLIVLEYRGPEKATKAKPVVLVGKAVTFDTGGYSLKDKDGIVGMKYDKCGAMAVIGTIQAAATLKIKRPVVGVIAAAENMIAGNAYRPNDIVTTMSGKTVEIISTDAEGRMVLADALTYAQKHYHPSTIIDLATLTGGIVVALGSVRAGLFSNNDGLANALMASGERTQERLWRMPLDEEYVQLIKGDDSDLKNSGGRKAHPVIGGIFLKQFVADAVPWAHLDIAGVADTDKDSAYCPKGATGFGVRLLVDYLRSL